jgi:superfamily II DNA or RNA helicase
MLRDYQLDVYNRAREALKNHLNPCIVLPCRSGKSYIIKEICDKAVLKGSNVLVLAHRRLLLRQHKKLIKTCRFESILTEVNHLGEHGQPDLIIIDEAHISGASSYIKVCEYYKCPIIGFTATAKRLDNKPLSLFNCIINGIDADTLISKGLIAPYDLYAPKLNIDLNNVSMSGSDFNNEELGNVMCDKKIYGDIIKYYKQYADGKQAIAYCTNVKHSKSVCDLFNQNRIPAAHIDASTPESLRESIIQDFKDGKFKILCNCNLISEGITLPECEVCLLLRPTQSETLYIQQACRCLTPMKNKRSIIIDYVGNCYTHGLPTEPRIYTLDNNIKVRNASREPDIIARQCHHCFRVYKGSQPICPYCGFNNGKTKKQIEIDNKAELERITELHRKQARREVGMARTESELITLAKKRGYKNPYMWAQHILISRRKKL